MHKKFEINRTKIRGGCQSGRKVVTQNSKSDLPLVIFLRLNLRHMLIDYSVPRPSTNSRISDNFLLCFLKFHNRNDERAIK